MFVPREKKSEHYESLFESGDNKIDDNSVPKFLMGSNQRLLSGKLSAKINAKRVMSSTFKR